MYVRTFRQECDILCSPQVPSIRKAFNKHQTTAWRHTRASISNKPGLDISLMIASHRWRIWLFYTLVLLHHACLFAALHERPRLVPIDMYVYALKEGQHASVRMCGINIYRCMRMLHIHFNQIVASLWTVSRNWIIDAYSINQFVIWNAFIWNDGEEVLQFKLHTIPLVNIVNKVFSGVC